MSERKKQWKPEDMQIVSTPPSEAIASINRDAKAAYEIKPKLQEPVTPKVVVPQQPRARVRTFIAKPCSLCASVREQDKTINKSDNFTRVFATRGNIRYCRCHYCGNTWKDSDSVPHSGS